jgi:hypothetical protein
MVQDEMKLSINGQYCQDILLVMGMLTKVFGLIYLEMSCPIKRTPKNFIRWHIRRTTITELQIDDKCFIHRPATVQNEDYLVVNSLGSAMPESSIADSAGLNTTGNATTSTIWFSGNIK